MGCVVTCRFVPETNQQVDWWLTPALHLARGETEEGEERQREERKERKIRKEETQKRKEGKG
jgi:hypothetical protein